MASQEVVLNCKKPDQFAAHLADDIVKQSLNTVSWSSVNTTHTSPTHILTDVKDVDNMSNCSHNLEFSNERNANNYNNYLRNMIDEYQDSQKVRLKRFAQGLCCDIINGALQSLDNSTKRIIPAKWELLSSHSSDKTECKNVSTERTETFYHCSIRPTLVINASPKKRRNTNDTNSHTKAKRKKTRYKKKLDKELTKLKPVKSNVSSVVFSIILSIILTQRLLL